MFHNCQFLTDAITVIKPETDSHQAPLTLRLHYPHTRVRIYIYIYIYSFAVLKKTNRINKFQLKTLSIFVSTIKFGESITAHIFVVVDGGDRCQGWPEGSLFNSYYNKIYIYISFRIISVCQWSVRRGFNPSSSHTQDSKSGTWCLLASHTAL